MASLDIFHNVYNVLLPAVAMESCNLLTENEYKTAYLKYVYFAYYFEYSRMTAEQNNI